MLKEAPLVETAETSVVAATSESNILTAAKGGGVKFFGTLFVYGVRFGLALLFARLMGAGQYGIYSLADTTFEMLAAFAFLGLGPAMVRYIPIFVSRRDERSLWDTLQVGLGIPFMISALMGIGLFIFANPIAELAFHEPSLTSVLRIAAVGIPFWTLVSLMGAAALGFKRMEYGVLAQDISFPLIKILLVVLLALTGLTALKAMSAHVLGVIAGCFILFYLLNKLFRLKRPLGVGRTQTREMFKFSLPLYASDLITLLGNNVEILLLGALNTAVGVGIFRVADRVSAVGNAFYSSIFVASMPVVSELYHNDERQSLGRFYQTMTKWTFTFNLPLFLINIMFADSILAIFGESFVAGSIALTVLAIGNLTNALAGICGVLVVMTGKTWLNTLNSILVLTLTLTLNLLLIPRFGVLGAAAAMATAMTVLNLARLTQVYVLFRFLPYNRGYLKPITAGALAAIGAYAVSNWVLVEASIINTVINVSSLLGVYAVAIWLLGFSEEDRIVLGRIGGRLKDRFMK
ncbi:MAG: flippase [Anaerolineae bacterium]